MPASPAPPPATASLRPRSHPLADLVLTRDPLLRSILGMCLLASLIYAGWVGLTWLYIVPSGMCSPGMGYVFTVHELTAILCIYPLIRSGRTRAWQDPGLVAVQSIWASAGVVLAYAVVPGLRAGVLQILCLIQVFGFLSLRPRSALLTAGTAIVMLATMWITMAVQGDPGFNPTDEALKIGPTCFILALLAWQSRNFGRSRQRMLEEKQSLAHAIEKVRQITMHDVLTGLFNRQHLQSRIDTERDRAMRSGHGFSIVLIDLDHFKHVNDTHGHHVGDDVLVSFAAQAQAALRETDVVGRWGGEEFVVVMPETEPAQVGLIGLNRLTEALRHAEVSAHAPGLRVTFSAGVAAWHPGESTEQLMQRADRALYQAKAQGRNRAVVAN